MGVFVYSWAFNSGLDDIRWNLQYSWIKPVAFEYFILGGLSDNKFVTASSNTLIVGILNVHNNSLTIYLYNVSSSIRHVDIGPDAYYFVINNPQNQALTFYLLPCIDCLNSPALLNNTNLNLSHTESFPLPRNISSMDSVFNRNENFADLQVFYLRLDSKLYKCLRENGSYAVSIQASFSQVSQIV